MKTIQAMFLAAVLSVTACATNEDAEPPKTNGVQNKSVSPMASDDEPPDYRPQRRWDGVCEGQKRNGERHYFTTHIYFSQGEVSAKLSEHIRKNPEETHFPRIQDATP